MSLSENPLDKLRKFLPQAHIEGDYGEFREALKSIQEDEGTERDWRNRIYVPRPLEWEENPDLVGKVVVPHTCAARVHDGNVGCICDCIGKPVVITGIYESVFVGTPSYNIIGPTPGSVKRIQEREFSEITRGTDPERVGGFIIENGEGRVLSAAFVWMAAEDVTRDGYIHNHQIVREIVQSGLLNDHTVVAHLASAKLDGTERLVGDSMPGQALKELFDPKIP